MEWTPQDSDDLLFENCIDDQDLHLLEPQEVRRLIWESVPLIDARSAQEYECYHINGAVHLPHCSSSKRVSEVLAQRSEPLVIYSNSQKRAEQLARRLLHMHYRHVYVLSGGIAILQPLQDA